MDYYLKAESEAALWSALVAAGAAVEVQVKDEAGNTIETRYAPASGYSLDIIGTIYKPTGNIIQQTVGDTTIEVPEMSPLSGFHANMRGPADLAAKTEIIPYVLTDQDRLNPNFVMPEPTINIIESPLKAVLVDPAPKTPNRVWA